MLYGHVETEEERVDHLLRLRELQDETHGFVDLHPAGVSSGQHRPRAHSQAHRLSTTLKTIAVSRLLLDNFDHIKAYWIMLTPSASRRSRCASAPTISTARSSKKRFITTPAPPRPKFTPRAELERLIRDAGRVPVERDTLYNRVDRSKMPPPPPAPTRGSATFVPASSLTA